MDFGDASGAGYVLGVDGGGTKTAAVLVRRDGGIAGVRSDVGSNPFDTPEWREVLSGVLKDLPGVPEAAAFGLAGHGEHDVFSRQQDELVQTLIPGMVHVMNDVEAARDGALVLAPGMLVLSGTGSMAWAVEGNGRSLRVGGWGAAFGDDGSAYGIGREALNRLSRVLDGREAGERGFASALAEAMGWPEDDAAASRAVLAWYGGLPNVRAGIASVARVVDGIAARGDGVARGILERAAGDLAAHVETARRGLGVADLAWSYGGSVFRSEIVREAVAARCGAPVVPVLPPIGGSVLKAAVLAGWDVDDGWVARLAGGLVSAGF